MCRVILSLGRCSECLNVDLWMSNDERCIQMTDQGRGMVCRGTELRLDKVLYILDQIPIGNCRVCQVLKNGKTGYIRGIARFVSPASVNPMMEYYILHRMIPESVRFAHPRTTSPAPDRASSSSDSESRSAKTFTARRGYDSDSDYDATRRASNMRRPRSPPRAYGSPGQSQPRNRRQSEQSPVPMRRDRRSPSPAPMRRDRRSPSPAPMRRERKVPSPSPVHRDGRHPSLGPIRRDRRGPSPAPVCRERRVPSPSPIHRDGRHPSLGPIRRDRRGPSPAPARRIRRTRSPSPIRRADYWGGYARRVSTAPTAGGHRIERDPYRGSVPRETTGRQSDTRNSYSSRIPSDGFRVRSSRTETYVRRA